MTHVLLVTTLWNVWSKLEVSFVSVRLYVLVFLDFMI